MANKAPERMPFSQDLNAKRLSGTSIEMDGAASNNKTGIAGRRKLEAVISAIPVVLVWCVVLNESLYVGLFGTTSGRVPLGIMALATTISWTYWTLKRFSEVRIVQVKWLPSVSTNSLVFVTLVFLANVIFWAQTGDSRYLLAGIVFPVFYALIGGFGTRERNGSSLDNQQPA